MDNRKLRTIITQDAEVDDQNSLRHFLLYSNEVEVQGIVETSSMFHWAGIPGTPDSKKRPHPDFPFQMETAPFSEAQRWRGTQWMFDELDDYEKDYPNLCKHADGYPSPDYLRSITKAGNTGYEDEMEAPSEGSELIRKCILADDDRPLYIQVWGGTNTIARALQDIQAEFENTPEWEALHAEISRKVIMTACGEQDHTYRDYIAEEWPDILFVKTLQMWSYAYPWLGMPEGDSKDTLRAEFMKKEILNGKCALTAKYCTWLDGQYYEGEPMGEQYGANPDIVKSKTNMGGFRMPTPVKYDFLSEGDSPTFLVLFDWGFRTLENFGYGGIAGRYVKQNEKNSKGQPLNYWNVTTAPYTDRDGNIVETESMWRYVVDIQNDFASRVGWAGTPSYAEAEHAPSLSIKEGLDLTLAPGQTVTLHAEAVSPDGHDVAVTYRVYEEASSPCAAQAILTDFGNGTADITIPADAKSGDQIHVISQAKASGHHKLVHYQQVIITVQA